MSEITQKISTELVPEPGSIAPEALLLNIKLYRL